MRVLGMVDYLIKTPAVFFLFALSLWFCLYQMKKLNELSE
jgi:hypothetical protein